MLLFQFVFESPTKEINMNKKKIIISSIISISLTILTICIGISSTHTISAEKIIFSKKIDISEIKHNDNSTKIKISYQLPVENPTMLIEIDPLNNLNIDKLSDEIGKNNLDIDLKKHLLTLDLKNITDTSGKGELKLETKNQDKTTIKASDFDNEVTQEKTINKFQTTESDSQLGPNNGESNNTEDTTENEPIKDESTEKTDVDSSRKGSSNISQSPGNEINDNEEDSKSGWERHKQLLITTGPEHALPNGSKAVSVIYFGALNYALSNLWIRSMWGGDAVDDRPGGFIIGDLVGSLLPDLPGDLDSVLAFGSGKGRKDNITAPNSAVIIVPDGGKVTDEQTRSKKKNHWFTNTFGDGMLQKDGHNVKGYYGSQRNFVTTNLLNYSHKSEKENMPNIAGPDFAKDDKIGMVEDSVNLYVRRDPRNSKGYLQQRMVFHQLYQRGRKNYRVKISITQGFSEDGSIYVRTEFKNIGNIDLPDFTGYAFRDITFMKDYDFNDFEKDNVLRSLGANRGIYASRKNFNGSIEFHMNEFSDAPYAWSARGTKSTWFSSKDENFPWNSNSTELFGKPNAFEDVNDVGDNHPDRDPGLGNRWAGEEGQRGWDSGISMHTKNQTLKVGQSVSMSYATDVAPSSDNPMIELHQKGTKENPDVIQPDLEKYKIDGGWFHFGHKNVEIKYIIGSNNISDPKEIIKHGKNISKNTQTEAEQKVGKRFPWETEIPVGNLPPGIHHINIVAVDENTPKRYSSIKEVVINKPSKATIEPKIKIMSPNDITKNNPYMPTSDVLNLKGGFSDLDSDFVKITYQLDGSGPVYNVPNIGKNNKGDVMPWYLHDFSIKDINDFKLHHLTFTINDGDDSTPDDTVVFWFQRRAGEIEITAPSKINFGSHHPINGGHKIVDSEFNGSFKVIDRRKDDEPSVPLTLQMTEFREEGTNEKLNHNIMYNNKPLSFGTSNIIINDISVVKGEWETVHDYTKLLEKNLKMKFKKNHSNKPGTYKSTWTWSNINSL